MLDTFALIIGSSIPHYAVRILVGGVIALVAVLLCAAPLHKRYHYTKKSFFGVISTMVISVTIALVLSHIALIARSPNGTLSRRYGQLSIFACGQQVTITPNSLLSPSAGDGSYTVSSDGTMQYLGYEEDLGMDATLGSFFSAIGGSVSSNVVTLPLSGRAKHMLTNQLTLEQFTKQNALNESYIELRSGESCSVTPSMVSIYVYRFNASGNTYEKQRIIQHPEAYSLSSQPYDKRDCIVVVFGDPKDSGTLTCNDYPKLGMLSPIIQEVSL